MTSIGANQILPLDGAPTRQKDFAGSGIYGECPSIAPGFVS